MKAPKIRGTFALGKTLRGTRGTWASPDLLTYLYKWEDCGTAGKHCPPLFGQSRTRTLTASDVRGSVAVAVARGRSRGAEHPPRS